MAVAIRPIYNHCGSTLIIENEDGKPYCLLCGRQYHTWQDYGALGGQATLARYGREHFSELGKKGGRPRLRHLPAPEAKSKQNGGKRLPNRLGELKELWRERREELFVVSSSSQGG